ncbi:YihY/virulence factor BrkB family protein [Rhodococcus aerolatus]
MSSASVPRDPAVDVHRAVRSPVAALRAVRAVTWRTVTKAWDDSIFGMSAQGAFWQTLSLPPLLLGLLGCIGYVGDWFGAGTPELVQGKLLTAAGTVFSPAVTEQIIAPTVADVLLRGRPEVVSVGFLLSLWAGSSAVSSFVDSICRAHGQTDLRHPVWQRLFALCVYAAGLGVAVLALPAIAVGPAVLPRLFPAAWQAKVSGLTQAFYYPVVGLGLLVSLTVLYRLALPRPLPWRRLAPGALVAGAFFLVATKVLRVYLAWVVRTGYTYGALATPIAFLLFGFFLGFAIVLGAEATAAVEERWPVAGHRSLRHRTVEVSTAQLHAQLQQRRRPAPPRTAAPRPEAPAPPPGTVERRAA